LKYKIYENLPIESRVLPSELTDGRTVGETQRTNQKVDLR